MRLWNIVKVCVSVDLCAFWPKNKRNGTSGRYPSLNNYRHHMGVLKSCPAGCISKLWRRKKHTGVLKIVTWKFSNRWRHLPSVADSWLVPTAARIFPTFPFSAPPSVRVLGTCRGTLWGPFASLFSLLCPTHSAPRPAFWSFSVAGIGFSSSQYL